MLDKRRSVTHIPYLGPLYFINILCLVVYYSQNESKPETGWRAWTRKAHDELCFMNQTSGMYLIYFTKRSRFVCLTLARKTCIVW